MITADNDGTPDLLSGNLISMEGAQTEPQIGAEAAEQAAVNCLFGGIVQFML